MDKWDEYKFFAESTQYLSERRQAAAQTYLGVNTAVLAILGFLVKDVGLRGASLPIIILPLFLAGLLACWIWYKIVKQYKALIGWRYNQLMEMERAMPQSHQMYVKEWEDYFKPRMGKETFGFSRLEVLLPRFFMVLYILYGVGLVVASVLGWFRC